MKLTQAQRILSRLKEQGYVYSWEITSEMGIQQYNARISDAREIIGCLFVDRKHSLHCPSHEHILSETDNKYIYVNENQQKIERIEANMQSKEEIENRLHELRIKYANEKDSVKRGVIERQGRALRVALQIMDDPEAQRISKELA